MRKAGSVRSSISVLCAMALIGPLLTTVAAPAATAAEPTTVRFDYTGGGQYWTVPAGVTAIRAEAWGAQGGGSYGGPGARVSATLSVTPGETLQVRVGGSGATGGFNGGGGTGWAGKSTPGGGGTDIRRGPTLTDRLMVAGGGGGSARDSNGTYGIGGAGGPLEGQAGANGSERWAGGGGGTQTAGGASGGAWASGGGFGAGGESYAAGSGGGGWYGGGGGASEAYGGTGGGGGGGSSYVVAGAADASHSRGFRAGHGLLTISYPPDQPGTGTSPNGSLTFDYTGGSQVWTVPDGVRAIRVQALGAQGGGALGGYGGRAEATVAVVPGQALFVFVGGRAGFNGGSGAGGAGGTSGGGASDIRIGGLTLADRAVVAAGGGGASKDASTIFGTGGSAGSPDGQSGSSGDGRHGGGGGGTQAAGGASGGDYAGPGGFGVGGGSYVAGGGGGGWYGGGGGGGNSSGGSGGGGGAGSSYAFPSATAVQFDAAVRAGDGSVTISYPPPTPTLTPPPAAGSATFSVTGAPQTWTVPEGVQAVRVDAKGAQGEGAFAGPGGRIETSLIVRPGQTLFLFVGGQGSAGGYNGGAATGFAGGTRGGGASDVRTGGFRTADRVVVAAGGGGSAPDSNGVQGVGGAGGGLVGGAGADGSGSWRGGGGGTQTTGGASGGAWGAGGGFGAGGSTAQGGGGGGGWYGGGGGGSENYGGSAGGGGGGSCYAGPGTFDAYTTPGARAGDGEITLSWPVTVPPSIAFGDDSYGEYVNGVHLGSGNLVEKVTDVSVATSGPDLAFARTYNSLDDTAGALGRGWRHSFDVKATTNATTGAVTVEYPDGRSESYQSNGDATYRGPSGYATTLAARAGGGWELRHKDRTTSLLAPDGRLEAVRDAHGRQLTLAYAGTQLTGVRDDASGRTLTFGWTGERITTVSTDAVTGPGYAGPLTWRYVYSGNLLTKVCDARDNDAVTGRCTTYDYTADRLSAIRRPRGNAALTVAYQPDGKVDWTENGARNRMDYGYGAGVSRLVDGRGNTTWYFFDPLYRTTQLVDAAGGSTTYTYDTNGYRSKVTDPNGNSTTFSHDARGNAVSQTNGEGQTTWFSYEADNLAARRDARSTSPSDDRYKTSFTYNPAGEKLSETSPPTSEHPAGITQRWAYTAGGEDFGWGPVPAGLLRSYHNGVAETTYGYDSEGDLRRQVDPSGLVTTHDHDPLGRTISTGIAWDAGQSATTVQGWDQLGNVVEVTEPAVTDTTRAPAVTHQRRTALDYDANGNRRRIAVSDITGDTPERVTTVDYDDADRPWRTTDAEGGQAWRTFDGNGNVESSTDAEGRTYRTDYNSRNQPTKVVLVGFVDDPMAPSAARDLTVRRIGYDAAGRKISEASPAPGTGGLTGQLPPVSTAMVERGFDYDKADRLVRVTLKGYANRPGVTPATRDVVLESYAYDPAGNRVTAAQGGGKATSTQSFDEGARLQSTTLELGTTDLVTDFDYDALGKPTRRTTTEGPAAVETRWAYDGAGRLTAETTENGTDDLTSTFGWDQRGLPAWAVDARGNAVGADRATFRTDYFHDPLGQLVEVRSPVVSVDDGTTAAPNRPTTRFGHDAVGNATAVVDPRGHRTATSFDRLDRAVRIDHPPYTPPGGAVIEAFEAYTYDRVGNLLTSRDRRGQTSEFAFDARNRVVARLDPLVAGAAARGSTRYTYDDAGNRTSVVDATGAKTTQGHDALGRLRTDTAVVRQDAPGGSFTTTYDYDDLDNLTYTADPTGVVMHQAFDAASRRMSVTDGDAKVTSYRYDPAGRLTAVHDPLARQTEHQRDPAGRETARLDKDPAGTVLAAEYRDYDAAGNVVAFRSARSASPADDTYRTTYRYDTLSRLSTVAGPDGATTNYGYDAAGNLSRLVDGRNNTTTYTWTPWNTPASTVEPPTTAHGALGDRSFTTTYDAGGLPVRDGQPGAAIDRSFDELGRLLTESGSGPGLATATRSFGYDLAGRSTSVSHPGGAVTLAYDDRGLLLSASKPGSATAESSFRYDGAGRTTSRTDAAGTTSFSYTNRGDLDILSDPLTGKTVDWGYNDARQPSSIAYGADTPVTRTLTYDARGRLDTDTLAAGGATVAATDYDLDPEGNLAAQRITAPGNPAAGEHAYGYDTSGRLASWAHPGASSPTTYAYDKAGNRARAGERTFAYDERNRLTDQKAPPPPRGDVLFKVGSPTSPTSSDTAVKDRLQRLGFTVTVSDDDGSSAAQATGKALVVISESASTRNIAATYKDVAVPAIVLEPLLYDDFGMTGSGTKNQGTSTKQTSVAMVAANAAHPLAAGRTGTVKTTAVATTYGWGNPAPAAVRISTTTASTDKVTQFAYEAGAAMTSGAAPARRVGFFAEATSAANLTAEGAALFDAAADWAAPPPTGITTYEWSARGTLNSVRDDAGSTAVAFDALGRQTAWGQTAYTYDGLDRAVTRDATPFAYAGTEIDPSAYGTQHFTRTPTGDLTGFGDGATSHLVGANRHGDLSWLLDGRGTVTDTRVWGPYGETAGKTGSAAPAVGFQSDFTDPSSGNVWMGARWYQPGTATFTSRDPVSGQLQTPVTLNRYTYANGDPLEHLDPDGHSALSVIGGAASSALNGVVSAVNRAVVQPVISQASAAYQGFKAAASTVARAATSVASGTRQAMGRAREKVATGIAASGRFAGTLYQAVSQQVQDCWRSQTCRAVVTATAVVTVGVAMPALIPGMVAGGLLGTAFGSAICNDDAMCILQQALSGAAGGAGGGLGGAASVGRVALVGAKGGGASSLVNQALGGRFEIKRFVKDVWLGAGFGVGGRAVFRAVAPLVRAAPRLGERATNVMRRLDARTIRDEAGAIRLGAAPNTAGSGPVTFRPPPGATADEIAQVRAYVDGCNAALCAGQLSPTGRVSTSGALRADASRAAAAERARAAAAGSPYSGHAGHVPDTTWTGSATPPSWMDLTPRVNTSLGGQSVHYPVGYRPTVFEFLDDL